tara:strand:+ start:32 stop:262 length:231 start_codon:yes stop_codon:yes gene_type:complete
MKEDKHKYIPDYENVGRLAEKIRCSSLRNFVVFPSEVARITYNKAVKLGIIPLAHSGKKWHDMFTEREKKGDGNGR